MKGIAHFSVGVAFASCFTGAVQAGAAGTPLYFILGGVFGLLPDTLDFKFYKFLYRRDIEVSPDPDDPDPQIVADGVAVAVNRAFATGEPVRIKLNTMRLGSDLWQQYKVKFDVGGRKVSVSIGPVVRMDLSVVSGSWECDTEASARLACCIKPDYETETNIDILDGPLFEMMPGADGRVSPLFIPWHRAWSHSLVVGLLFALVTAVVWGPLGGVVALGAYSAHILLDQLGFMGSNLLFPYRLAGRTGGLNLVHSGEMFPNFSTVWLSCLLIFWNLYCDLPRPAGLLNPVKLFFYGAVVPFGVFIILRRAVARYGDAKPPINVDDAGRVARTRL